MKLKIYTDGGARGNPGPGAIGVVIKNEQDLVVYQFGKAINICTNNVAEYSAIIEALKWVLENQKSEIENRNLEGIHFFVDSQLVVSQLNGLFRAKNAKIRDLIIQIRQFEQEVGGNVSYQAIPREQNKLADSLVNQALDYGNTTGG